MCKTVKSKILGLWLGCFFMCFFLFTAPAYALEVPAKGGVLLDNATGKVLFQQNSHTHLYPASTTKVLTALLALENLDLSNKITLPKDFVNPGESSIWLEPGEKHSVEDLLMSMMLKSANDAAAALAIGVAGSVEEFAEMMNAKVKELGLTDSHFVNPNGLHDDDHYTSAYDLAMITREALKNEDFNRIIITKRHQLPWVLGEYDRVVYNANTFLKIYEYGDGVKNGYTKQAGNCLVSSATKEDMRLVGVVLNCSDMYNQSAAMMEYGFNNYHTEKLVKAGTVIATLNVSGGKKTTMQVVTEDSISTVMKNGKEPKAVSKINMPEIMVAPVLKGDKVGTVTYTDADGFSQTTNLLASENIWPHTLAGVLKRAWFSIWQVMFVPLGG